MIQKCFIVVIGMAAAAPFAHSETRVTKSVVQTDTRTGKLVRRTIVKISEPSATPPSPSERPASEHLKDLIDAIAAKHEVEPPLVHSVIRAESNYNPLAVSNKGAQGLMQLIPATARRFGVKDSFDSEENVEGGVKYLRYLIDLFHGDYTQAVAAYNAGEAAVTRYGGVPPYKETQNYVAEVARHLDLERRAVVLRVANALSITPQKTDSADLSAPPTETYTPIVASVAPDGRIYYRTP